VESLLKLGAVPFPASVSCLIILFFVLLLAEQIAGEQQTRRLVAIIEVPVWVLPRIAFAAAR
jgi:hypothetical protein